MKNKIAFTFLISAFLFTLSITANAFWLDFTYGYYNTTVFV